MRDRPQEQAQAADEKHKFDDEKSEFMGYLKLWKWLDESRGGHGTGTNSQSRKQRGPAARELRLARRVMREWRDVYSQLHTVVAEHGWRLNQSPATYEQSAPVDARRPAGNIGCKSDDEDWYLGARGIKFYRHPART